MAFKSIKIAFGLLVGLSLVFGVKSAIAGQDLGTFQWGLDPHCNVLVIQVEQLSPSLYQLHGYDDFCGSTEYATLTGTAVVNSSGSIDFGITMNGSLGTFIRTQIHALLDSASLSGPWDDDFGQTGTFNFLGTSALKSQRQGEPYPGPGE